MTLSDDALLDLVQRRTLAYFWDFAHPVSGMARERSAGAVSYDVMETVTTGGTGFGIMALIAGAERGFLPRAEVETHITKIVDFLSSVTRYNGAFAHWMNGTTGETVAFSKNDTGGDIVETAFLMMGLIAARQWLGPGATATRIDALWHAVNWAGFCRAPEALMWHWHPGGDDWAVGLPITGYHEALIAFVLGLASPTHPIDPAAFRIGWKTSKTYRNGKAFFGIRLPLGPDYGGPLFFTQYSFLGLDPRGLTDADADYFAQNRAHALIHHAYAQANPKGFSGYGPAWGLTACDGDRGYNAFSPMNDQGVIAPTAALSSLPYTPKESLAALRHYHEALGPRIWGDLGFRDAFNETAGWVAESHIAIDQGPIVGMIENARTGLLWRLFMSAPEIAPALAKMGMARRIA